MPRLKFLWFTPLVCFLFGTIFFEEFPLSMVPGIVLALAGLFVQGAVQYTIMLFLKKKLGFLKSEKRFMYAILMLAAEMAKIDGRVTESELKLIKGRLEADFDPEESAHYYQLFQKYLNNELNIKETCKVINYEFDASTKAHLMYLLVSIATADGILTEAEISLLKRISTRADIRIATLVSILKMFQFEREKVQQEREKRKTTSSTSSLKTAYSILELEENASITAIKKAYRRLAKTHHPDRVTHLGPEFQTKAKEKFQKIADAYELIKTRRNFN